MSALAEGVGKQPLKPADAKNASPSALERLPCAQLWGRLTPWDCTFSSVSCLGLWSVLYLALLGGWLLETALEGSGSVAGPQSSMSGLLRTSPASRDRQGAGPCQLVAGTGRAAPGAAGWGNARCQWVQLRELRGRRLWGPPSQPGRLWAPLGPPRPPRPSLFGAADSARRAGGGGVGPQWLPAHAQLRRRGQVQLCRSGSLHTGGEEEPGWGSPAGPVL